VCLSQRETDVRRSALHNLIFYLYFKLKNERKNTV
jgi:hypothetical protein